MKLKKLTKPSSPLRKNRYEDACAATHGMDIIGERWALPVMRELMMGPRRFGELRASLRDISANILTQRLAGLEAVGIIRRRTLPPPASAQVYELTDWGYEAGPIFQVMGRWAVKSPLHDATAPFSAVSLMLSLRTMAAPDRIAGLVLRIVFHLDGELFHWIADDGAIAIGRGEIGDPDCRMTADPSTIAAAVYGAQKLSELEKDGALTIEGDRHAAQKFATLFPMPKKPSES